VLYEAALSQPQQQQTHLSTQRNRQPEKRPVLGELSLGGKGGRTEEGRVVKD